MFGFLATLVYAVQELCHANLIIILYILNYFCTFAPNIKLSLP